MSALAARRLTARLPTRAPAGSAAVACVVLAALSLLIPSAPTTDPWGWIIWGHELIYGGFSTVMGGAPSWKPLPVLFTAPLSLAGHDAAPALWLLVARAGGLYSLVVAWRLGGRLGGPVAGVLAAVGLVISGNWVRAFAHGYTEPLAIGLLLAAVEAHLSGRGRRALALGTATALVRPEAFPLLVVYALVLLRRSQARWQLAAALVAAVPALWVIPDWAASGIPGHASKVAAKALPSGTANALHSMLEAVFITPAPLTVCALAAVAVTHGQRRRAVRGIVGLALGWAAVLAALLLAGYPPSERFFVLPAALLCVTGAVGAVRLLRSPGAPVLTAALAAALALGLVARGVDSVDAVGDSVSRARLEHDLHASLQRAGLATLRRCGRPLLPHGLTWVKGLVAYDLDIRPVRVKGARTSAPGYVHQLAAMSEERLPPRPPRLVQVRFPKKGRFVLLSPFGRAQLRPVGRARRLRVLASAGRWRVLVPEGACG